MRRFNFDEFIWFILLSFLTTLWAYLILTGTLYNLVNKSMVKYSYFAFFAFLILTIFQISKIFTFPSRTDMSNKFIPLIFTLFMAVGYMALNSISVNSSTLLLREDEVLFNYTGNYISIDSNHNRNTLNDINTDSFPSSYTLIEELGPNSEYIGKTISIVGYIDKNDTLPKNTFLISRDEISCCLQDLRTISILSKDNKSLNIQNNSWVKALGKIRYDNGNVFLEIIEIFSIKEPEKIYI